MAEPTTYQCIGCKAKTLNSSGICPKCQIKIGTLKEFARENYEAGGHWVFETHDDSDYVEELASSGANVQKAKAKLKSYWKLMNEQERNCAYE